MHTPPLHYFPTPVSLNSSGPILARCKFLLFSLFSSSLFSYSSLSLFTPSSAPVYTTPPIAAVNSVLPTPAPATTLFPPLPPNASAPPDSVTPAGPALVPIAPTCAPCVSAPPSFPPTPVSSNRTQSLANMRRDTAQPTVTDSLSVVFGQLFPKKAWRRARVASYPGGWTAS